jgi:hypothetical protein
VDQSSNPLNQHVIFYANRAELYFSFYISPLSPHPLDLTSISKHLDPCNEEQISDSNPQLAMSRRSGRHTCFFYLPTEPVPTAPPLTPLATPLILVWDACLWSWTKELALLSCNCLAANIKILRDAYIIRGIDGANHARLAMVILVLRTVERDRIGILDGHRKGWLTGSLTCLADQESRVERAIGLAGSGAASSSRSHGVVLIILARIHYQESQAYSGNPDPLDCIANVGGNGSRSEDPLPTGSNLDLVRGSIGGRNASRSSNDRLGEMHG